MTGLAQIWDPGGETREKDGKRLLNPLGEPVWHITTAGIGFVAYVGFSPAGDAFVTCAGPIFNKPESLRFWSVPREPLARFHATPEDSSDGKIGAAKKRVPDWLPELTEAVSGTRLTPHGYESTTGEPSFTTLEKKIRASASGGN
jgi:hypothetical protein